LSPPPPIRCVRLAVFNLVVVALSGCSLISALAPEEEGGCENTPFLAWADATMAATVAVSALPVAIVKSSSLSGPGLEPKTRDDVFYPTLFTLLGLAALQAGSAGYGFNASGKCEAKQMFKAHGKDRTELRLLSPITRLQAECASDDQRACIHLGMRLFLGSGIQKDLVLSNSLFATACEAGIASACYNLAGSYEHGTGVEQDTARAQLLYQRACLAGDFDSCGIELSEPPSP
jgi:hypothetical protein